MDELESKLNAIFSSPESMEQIRNIAQSLAGSSASPSAAHASEERVDPRIMQVMTKAVSEFSKPSEAAAMIYALRPYLNPDRMSKIDKALNIAKLARIAKTILPEFGGDGHV